MGFTDKIIRRPVLRADLLQERMLERDKFQTNSKQLSDLKSDPNIALDTAVVIPLVPIQVEVQSFNASSCKPKIKKIPNLNNGRKNKQIYAIIENMKHVSRVNGQENMFLITMTTVLPVLAKELTKRINSMNRILKTRFVARIRILEQGKEGGRWHVHFVAVIREHLRGPGAIETEKKFWKNKCKKYHFGRIDLRPVTDLARLGGYLTKNLSEQDPSGRKTRRVTYSQGWRIIFAKFSWARGISREYRLKMKEVYGEDTGIPVGYKLIFGILQRVLLEKMAKKKLTLKS